MVPQLQFRDVTLGYDRHPAVHHLNGEVAPGALLAVVHQDVDSRGFKLLLKILVRGRIASVGEGGDTDCGDVAVSRTGRVARARVATFAR